MQGWDWLSLPATGPAVLRWMMVIALPYIVVREIVALIKRGSSADISFSFASDAVMFSTSMMLLMGAWNEPTMRAIGDNSLFLLFAGIVGVHGTVRSIFR